MTTAKNNKYPNKLIHRAIYYRVGFTLSYAEIAEIFHMEGMKIHRATIGKLVLKSIMKLEKSFHKRKKPVGDLWKINSYRIKVVGTWCYLYRATDENKNTINYLLTKEKTIASAYDFLEKAIKNNKKVPLVISIPFYNNPLYVFKIATKNYNKSYSTNIHIIRGIFFNTAPFDDGTLVLKRIRNYISFRNFQAAQKTIIGIEIFRMIEKGQVKRPSKNHYKTLASLLK